MRNIIEICEATAKQIVQNYRDSIPPGTEYYNGGGGSPKPPKPPYTPSASQASANVGTPRKPKGFLSTIMTGNQPAVDNSQNMKTLLGS